MRRFGPADTVFINGELKAKCQAAVAKTRTITEAAQAFCDVLCGEFETARLVRIYVTAPYKALPEREKAFVKGLATNAGVGAQLDGDTLVLNLMGTHGTRSEWCDRRRSKGHLGIPLISAEFVESIPMIAQLLREFGIGTSWIGEKGASDLIIKSMGRMATVFYVPDAASYRDGAGRLVIPAQDFVTAAGIKTVFGVGGAYSDGSICVLLAFSAEAVDRATAERYMSLINFFKTSTLAMVTGRKLFA